MLSLNINLPRAIREFSRLGVLIDRDQDPHICNVQYDCPVSQYVMGAWLQFVDVSKRTFSSSILLLEFLFPPRILHSPFCR